MVAQTGVLLLNLGTPDAPDVASVRRYLREFLSDPRVIDLPGPLRWLLLYGVILPFRPFKTAKAYQSIWTEAGSPLRIYSDRLVSALQAELGQTYTVRLGMRYGNPGIAPALQALNATCERIVIFPLFPQYSNAASGSALARCFDIAAQFGTFAELSVRTAFYREAGFIDALKQVIRSHLEKRRPDFVLFSYHGLPVRHIEKAELADIPPCCAGAQACPDVTLNNRHCYKAQCFATTHALADALGLEREHYATSFQSRLGRTPWIQPFTDEMLVQLAERGIKHLAVACPSFVADCLETLEEIGLRAQAQWLALGGESLTLVPCLNDHPAWVQALAQTIRDT